MLTRKLIVLTLISSLLFGMLSIPISLSQITIYDSTFPLEEGKSIRWETVNATESPYNDFEYIKFTVDEIYNDTFDGLNALIVNYTLEFYHNFAWIPEDHNSFYLAYNYSMNYLNWSKIAYLDALPLIVPTPINFTLIGNAIEKVGPLNYSFSDMKLILDYRNTTTIEISYNLKGISTIIEKITNKTTMFKWELVTSNIVVRIPFENYFIIISIFTTGLLVVVFNARMRKSRIKSYPVF